MSVLVSKVHLFHLEVNKCCQVHPHRQDVAWIGLNVHSKGEFYVLPVDSVHFRVLNHAPAVLQTRPRLVQGEAPNTLLFQVSCVAGHFQVGGDFVDGHEFVHNLLVGASFWEVVLAAESRGKASFARFLAVSLAVDEDVAELEVLGDGPLGQFFDSLDPFLLEHLNEVFLDSVLEDADVLVNRCVFELEFLDSLRYFGSKEVFTLTVLLIDERFPLFGIVEIKAHQDWEVRLLDVDPDVFTADDCVDLLEGAHRVSWSVHLHVILLRTIAKDSRSSLLLLVEIALSSARSPQLNAATPVLGARSVCPRHLLAQDVHCVPLWHSLTEDNK